MDETEIKKIIFVHFDFEGDESIEPDGTINVNGDVDAVQGFPEYGGQIPVKFGKVTGHFNAAFTSLKTLMNCPGEVGGDLNVSKNSLSDFQGAPRVVGGKLIATGMHAKLTSLDGLPSSIGHGVKTAGPVVELDVHPDLGLLRLITANLGGTGANKVQLSGPPDLIKGLNNILPKYIGLESQGKRNAAAIRCSLELIRAGYKGNARL